MASDFKDCEAYDALAKAVCKQAADDFRQARGYIHFKIIEIDPLLKKRERGEDISAEENKILERYDECQNVLSEVPAFFNGEWGKSLSGLEGAAVMSVLQKEDVVPPKSGTRGKTTKLKISIEAAIQEMNSSEIEEDNIHTVDPKIDDYLAECFATIVEEFN